MNTRSLTHFIALAAVVAAAMLVTTPAEADEWTGPDKRLHAAAGAVIAGSVHEATGNARLALLAGTVAAVGKELLDTRMPGHTPSYKDALITMAGSALAVSFKGLHIGPGWVAYRTEF